MRAGLPDRIAVDPEVYFGKPRIAGTRIWVGLILGMVAEGVTHEEIPLARPPGARSSSSSLAL
jgi:uncharacterized protein (DUF433 family)